MKLLFDENLSPALVDALSDVYPEASHVIAIGMRPTDEAIWSYAATNGYVIVSKDADFYDRSVSRGAPPKVIWLRAVNCPTRDIAMLLRHTEKLIRKFVFDPNETCLVLRQSDK